MGHSSFRAFQRRLLTAEKKEHNSIARGASGWSRMVVKIADRVTPWRLTSILNAITLLRWDGLVFGCTSFLRSH